MRSAITDRVAIDGVPSGWLGAATILARRDGESLIFGDGVKLARQERLSSAWTQQEQRRRKSHKV